MPTNIPPKVRLALYILSALATPLVAYLFDTGRIGDAEVSLFAAYIVLVNALAAAKVSD